MTTATTCRVAHNIRQATTLLLVAIAFAFGFSGLAQAQIVGQGTVKAISGTPQIARPDQPVVFLQLGDAVNKGDVISTPSNSSVGLLMKDGTRMSLGANSKATLKEFAFDGTTEKGHLWMDLVKGTLRMITGAIAKTNPEQVKITTPTSIVGVRGTDFIVQAN